jgi:hypothetical protein
VRRVHQNTIHVEDRTLERPHLHPALSQLPRLVPSSAGLGNLAWMSGTFG